MIFNLNKKGCIVINISHINRFQAFVLQDEKKDEFIKETIKMTEKSQCHKTHVGAVLLIPSMDLKKIPILKTCNARTLGVCENKCLRDKAKSGTNLHDCVGSHAEEAAILLAAKHGMPTEGGILFCSHFPCFMCAKMIVLAGIKYVFYRHEYNTLRTKMLFDENNITCKQHVPGVVI